MRARLAQADSFAEDVVNIADSLDERIRTEAERAIDELDPESETYRRDVATAHHLAKVRSVEAAKLQIDARKWTAGRMHPNAWGDRVTLQHSNPNGSPLKINLSTLTDSQLEKIAALSGELNKDADGGT